ncbi:MAG: hypothetical protein ACXVW1_00160 [Nocardioides sp.]
MSRTPAPGAAVVGAAVAAACLLLGSVAGCSIVKDPSARARQDQPSVSPTGPVASESPTSAPLAFDDKARRTFPEADVRGAAAGDDVVLTMTATTVVGRSLPDLRTAYVLNAADDRFTDLRADADAGVGYTLEVTTRPGDGTAVGQVEYAVQRFDLKTGEVRDTVTATLPQDPHGSANDAVARIAAVEGDRVVLDSFVPGSGAHAVVVVDLANTARAWQAQPAQVLAATGDLVVASTGSPQRAGRVEALELDSGHRRWTALPGTLGASALGTTDRSVVVARDDSLFPGYTVTSLRLADGHAGTPRPVSSWNWSCEPTTGPAARAVTVCTVAGADSSRSDRVVGWDLARGHAVWRLPDADRFAPIVTAVRGDLVYGLLDSGQGVVLDGVTGRDVSGDTGGAPSAVNDWGGVVVFDGTAYFLPATPPDDASRAAYPTESPTVLPTG